MKPSIKLRLYAYALNIDRQRRDQLLARADELVTVLADKRDYNGLAQAIADESRGMGEATFVCHTVDEILRRRFRSPYRARAVIFTVLSSRCAEIINRRINAARPPVVSSWENETRAEGAASGAEILLAACDSGLRDSCASMIRSISCEVTTISDGLAALNQLNQRDFDAIVCEFFLPTIDGDGLYYELAASKPHLRERFIFMTTRNMLSQPRVDAFRQQTRATFVILPCSTKTLTGAVSAHLRTRAACHENTEEERPRVIATTTNVIARERCDYIATRVIADLQAITDLLFGNESGLENLWEEICVQRQGDESEVWSTYEETVNILINAHLEDLSEQERRAVWLETDQGIDWQCEEGNEQYSEPPVSERDIAEHIAGGYVYTRADEFSNSRIASFLSSREFSD